MLHTERERGPFVWDTLNPVTFFMYIMAKFYVRNIIQTHPPHPPLTQPHNFFETHRQIIYPIPPWIGAERSYKWWRKRLHNNLMNKQHDPPIGPLLVSFNQTVSPRQFSTSPGNSWHQHTWWCFEVIELTPLWALSHGPPSITIIADADTGIRKA